jgi:hypothetical protein
MTIDRVRASRIGIPLILGADALFILAVGFGEASHPPMGGGFSVGTMLQTMIYAAFFVVPVALLLSGKGVERGAPAGVLAWLVGLGLPVVIWMLVAMSWGSTRRPDNSAVITPVLLVSGVHMLIPAMLRWARGKGSLPTLWFRAAGALLGAGALMFVVFW